MRASEPLTYQFYEEHLFPQIEVFGGPNFFPLDLCQKLVDLSDAAGERKIQFDFSYPLAASDEVPSPIRDAAMWSFDMRVPTNTAILKKYNSNDIYESGAYKPHVDPEIFGTQRLALISLSGEAELTVTTSDGEAVTFPCCPGTALFIAPHLLHRVSGPLNLSGIRHFLFMGYKKV